MHSLATFLDLDHLKSISVVGNGYPDSPHALLEGAESYSIVMNLLGVNEEDIAIRVNGDKREIAVLAKKEAKNAKRGFFWIFGVPAEGWLEAISFRYKGGVLEVTIPKFPRSPFDSVA